MTRVEKLLSRVGRNDKVLEVGAGYNPTITRAEGWNVYSLDHASAQGLRDKYRKHAEVDISRIQEVDFVWSGGALASAIPQEHLGTFDAIIASHVIEHQPDLVGFFQSISSALRVGGLLALAVPDKRFCFDYFIPTELTGEVLEAASVKRTRHTRKTRYNHIAYSTCVDGYSAWTQEPIGKLSFRAEIEAARRASDEQNAEPDAPYIDSHAWHFTPASFKLILLELRHLGLVDLEEAEYFPPAGCEFFMILRKASAPGGGDADVSEKRMELLKQMLIEIREQTDFLILGKSEDVVERQPLRLLQKRVGELDAELASEKEGRRREREELHETQTHLQTRVNDLELKLAAEKKISRQLVAAIKRWNSRPWYSKAVHKLRYTLNIPL